MKILIRIYKYTYLLTALCWLLAGSIVLASFFIDNIHYIQNIILGLFFVGIACFLLLKMYYTIILTQPLLTKTPLVAKRFFVLDFVFMLFHLLLAIFSLSGASYRFFIEKLSVFG